jgi:hypothetical protein
VPFVYRWKHHDWWWWSDDVVHDVGEDGSKQPVMEIMVYNAT